MIVQGCQFIHLMELNIELLEEKRC